MVNPLLWIIRIDFAERPADALRFALEDRLDPFATALSSFAEGKGWRIEAIAENKPERAALRAALAAFSGVAPRIVPLPDKDWVKESERGLGPIRAGRFFIHGSHFTGRPPAGMTAFEIDASLAFGTGRHETTKLCLRLLQALKAEGRAPRRILDLGTGTGILAFAAATLFPRARILAVDNDRDSVRIARNNARRNGLADKVGIAVSDGYEARRIRAESPYELIIANILARPLIAMAPDLGTHLDNRGYALISGITRDQVPEIMAAHAPLQMVKQRSQGQWSALLLHKFSSSKKRLTTPRGK
ncbi:MAG TPA: 50S ribosomal protein L11 methyltransferase [Dongiaceae bacterium]|jgi:ribosomal protein L11 methyltransferase|nr:50S ribosomal protein L11 methyltransferase [Dongiaceae bacterium]